MKNINHNTIMKKICALLLIAISLHVYAEEDRDDVLLYEFDLTTHEAPIAGAKYLNSNTSFWDDSVLYKGEGYAVTGIKDRAFQNNSTLNSFWFVMNKGYIGERAFAGCSNLKKILLVGGEELTIHANAFDGCCNTTYIAIAADRLILKCSSYSWYLPFTRCSGIDTVEWDVKQFDVPYFMDESLFDASKDHIIYVRFYGDAGKIPRNFCKNFSVLKQVVIDADIKKIGASSFQNCINLTSMVIPNSVLEIEKYAFDGCSAIETITIGNGVRTIGDYAFQNCRRIKSIIIPSSVTKIGYGSFDNCTSLETVRIQSTATMIDIAYSAFPSTTKVIFSDGTTMIGGVIQKKTGNTPAKPKPKLDKQTPPANTKKGLTKD